MKHCTCGFAASNGSMGGYLLFYGLLLNMGVYMTSDGISTCELNCVNEYDRELLTIDVVCEVQTGEDECNIPVEDLPMMIECDIGGLCYIDFSLTCSNDFKIVFQHPVRVSTDIMAIAVDIVNCSVDFENVGVFVSEVNVMLLRLKDWNTHKSNDSNSTEIIPLSAVESGQVIGLESLVMLILSFKGQQMKDIPSALRTRRWPMLVSLKLYNIIIGKSDFQALKLAMPVLQVLHISNSNLPIIPYFLLSSRPASIPKGFTNNAAYNTIYNSWGKDLRRKLFIEESTIRNLSYIQLEGQMNHISFARIQLDHLKNDTFSNVEGLHKLNLSFNQLLYLPRGIFNDLSSLTVLDLSHNHLNIVTGNHFAGLQNLIYLNLTYNNLDRLGSGMFSPLESLKQLDLSYNHISEIAHNAITSELDELSFVTVSNNNITDIPQWVFTTRSLAYVDLSFNYLTFDILITDLDSFSQQLLHIQNMSVEEFVKSTVQSEPIHVTTVNLRQNLFSTLNFTKIQLSNDRINLFQYLLSFFKLNMEANDINCDCNTLSLHRYLQEEKFKEEQQNSTQPHIVSENFELWQCMRPESVKYVPIVDVPEETFICPVDIEHCPLSCTCSIFDESIIVNCSNRDMSHFPEVLPIGVIMLNLSKNAFTSVMDMPYFQNLEILDLSQNFISSIDDTAVIAFTSMRVVFLHDNALSYLPYTFTSLQIVKLTLHGNFLVCDCHSKWISKWVKAYSSNIYDVEKITCASGLPRAEIVLYTDENQFVCKISKYKLIAIPLGIAVTIIFVFILLMYRFRDEIKVLLYFHLKWHPFDHRDDSDIHDKLYDAFVSYNQQDSEWVTETLCPVLEREEKPYRLHIHHRDFLPGGLIVENIFNGVKYSRRMILVLTHSFLSSDWCRLEFRAAHNRVLRDRNNYLIVILLDDINLHELDEDMKLYLRTNTYIDGRCRWFVQRLLYAMPEEPLAWLQHDQPQENEVFPL